MPMTQREWAEIGAFVAQIIRQKAQETIQQTMAGVAMYGTAAGSTYADPDGSTRTVVDVTVGSVIWTAVPVRTGETIASGDQVLVLMLGYRSPAGWLVLRS